MRNARFRPYWIQAEEKEWQGLWEKGVFKKWSRKDLLSNDRVFTSSLMICLQAQTVCNNRRGLLLQSQADRAGFPSGKGR